MVQYIGQDGAVHQLGDTPENSLCHWKYIKKIQTPAGTRYFYTMEALQAYYNDQRKVEDARFVKDAVIADRQRQERDARLRSEYEHDKLMTDGKHAIWLGTEQQRKETLKSYQKNYQKRQRMNRFLDKLQDRYLMARRVVNPAVKTAKRAVTPVDTPDRKLKRQRKKVDKWLRRYL